MPPAIYRFLGALLAFLGAAAMAAVGRAVTQHADQLDRLMEGVLVVCAGLIACVCLVTAVALGVDGVHRLGRRP